MQNLWYNQSYMNKTRAIIKYCIICLIVSLAVVLCFAEFTIPFTNTKYVGCYQAIKDKMGIDLNGGVSAVFEVEPSEKSSDLEAEVDATINRIKNTLSDQGYLEATVTRAPYVAFDADTNTGTFVRLPERNEFLTDIKENLIVEFYNR